jgi:hypothetical protein
MRLRGTTEVLKGAKGAPPVELGLRVPVAQAKATATAMAALNLDGKRGSKDMDQGLTGVKSGQIFFTIERTPTNVLGAVVESGPA